MKKYLILVMSVFINLPVSSQKYEIRSPDGSLTAGIEISNGIDLSIFKGSLPVLKLENIGLVASDSENPFSEFKVQKTVRRRVNEVVRPEIREKASELINSYNELEIRFRSKFAVTFRMFDEGLAYRFSTSLKNELTIYRENLELCFEDGDSVRFQSSGTFNSAYETPYEHEKPAGIGDGKLCNLPFLVEKKDGTFIMVTEADLYNYPGLWLKGTGQPRLSAVNPPCPKTLTATGSPYNLGQVEEAYGYIARVAGTRNFPWRIFAVAGDEAELVSNNMTYLLASPCAISDVSWIKPGVVMFDWWAKHNIYGVGFRSGINTETARYFIDFCAKHGFRYFLFDDGWSPGEDLLKTVPGLDIREVTAYGMEKGVDIMLWVIWHTLGMQWDEAFNQFEKWGIKGIKVDFMNRDDQPMIEFYEAVAAEAAKRKMVVDFHGACKPDGLRRKYPNVLTREALIEFEFNGWTSYDDPVHHNLLPYIRMFTGPMDYIPATMRNSTRENFRPVGDYPMGQGTRAHAMALFVILNSPMTMLPDSPSDYYREQECTGFLAGIPVVWDETRLLEGKIGKYTVLARRSGREWYLGAITDWDKRTISLKTDFLEPGRYWLEAVEDGINADKRAEDYIKVRKEFQAGDSLVVNLAPGGGWVARIMPVNQNTASGRGN